MALKVGDMAPDFELPAVQDGQQVKIRLSNFRGKNNVVVTFHPLDWTPTCGEQLPALNSDRDKFAALGAQLLDISVDSVYSHKAWQKYEIGNIQVPMCSDFFPHGEVAKAFGIMRQDPPLNGISERAVFIVDKGGKIAFAKVYPLDQAPKSEELLAELKKVKG
ncbi:MAG: redoxin domain-containing protein [Terriglobales bacterium]